MTDDIVTRLYKLCVCCRCGCGQICSDCEAADEIERLRADLQRSALQTNVMRNIATAPYGDASEQILDLGAELAECQSEYQKLWRKYNRLVRGD